MKSQDYRVGVDSPRRLETFLRPCLPTLSRESVRRLIATGDVLVDGRRAQKGSALLAGAVVTVPIIDGLMPQPELPVTIAFDDGALVVVNKPGGMPCHARDPLQRDTVAAWLAAHYPDTIEAGEPHASGLVHRLDTGTSGLLIAARSPAVFALLRTAFRERQVEKRYVAIAAGEVPATLSLESALAHDPTDRRRMRLAQPGDRAWRAETAVRHLGRHALGSLVEITMRSGVTHQIRVHLALAGHPIVGDRLYGGPAQAGLADGRHALHAAALTFAHPVSREAIAIEVALPDDLSALG